MELLREVQGAHGGERIYCAAIGPDKRLYTGGDDKVRRRRWRCCWGAAAGALQRWRRAGSALWGCCCSLHCSAGRARLAGWRCSGAHPPPPPRPPARPWLQMIRAWDPSSLESVPCIAPMGHEASVRALAAGCCSTLLSGDANGELAIWSL